MVWATVHNGGDTPVPISEDGHTLGGGEWGPAQTTDPVLKAAVDADAVVIVDAEPGEGQNPDAYAALQETARISDRAEQIRELDKPALTKLAAREGLIPEDADPSKGDLERLLARSSVNLPKPSAAKSRAAAGAKE